jgi:hypothetical protein
MPRSRHASIALPALTLGLLLAAAAPLAAAPGRLTSIGPFEASGFPRQILFPGSDPRRILVLSYEDLFETRDGGINWRSLLLHGPEIEPEKLIVDPTDADHFFLVGFAARRRTVIETRNGGRSWSPLALPAGSAQNSGLQNFFVDVAAPRTLVAEFFEYSTGYEHFLSLDGGASWSLRKPQQEDSRMLGVRGGIGFTRYHRADLRANSWTRHANFYPFGSATDLVFDRVRTDTLFVEWSNRIHRSSDGGATFDHQMRGSLNAFVQSPLNPSHLAWTSGGALSLSLDRGTTWVNEYEGPFAYRVAFDPATGEAIFWSYDTIRRRRLDGSPGIGIGTQGLNVFEVWQVAVAGATELMLDGDRDFHARDEEGTWRRRGRVSAFLGTSEEECYGEASILVSESDSRNILVACSINAGAFRSTDGGETFELVKTAGESSSDFSYDYSPILAAAGGGGGEVVYRLRRSESSRFYQDDPTGYPVYRSFDFGATWENLGGGGFLELVVHPDASRGLLAVRPDGRLMRYLPATGWQEVASAAGQLFLPDYDFGTDLGFGYDPAHPELVYSVHNLAVFRSLDFGDHWEIVASFEEAFAAAGIGSFALSLVPKIVVDPFDSEHFLIPYTGLATRDGGHNFQFDRDAYSVVAAFDPAAPGRFLTGSTSAGVLERVTTLPPCRDTAASFCAKNGRYLLTVDWKDPQGVRGKAKKVATGSEDSGLFYFFDPNNWELLVKVLDGCGINQRFWLLAAGTTDVEYLMKVEDRFTGQIRHYANAGGQAAPAVVDTDAFSGCAATPPPGVVAAKPQAAPADAAGGEASLLLAGRFEVETRWTDFAGIEGDALTAPLRSENAGLFYFFSPDNWEMLVKVLDGCAINNHYWVLAAATTDVGYRMTVSETDSTRSKVYQNPVGRAAPALLDLQAFTCPAPR